MKLNFKKLFSITLALLIFINSTALAIPPSVVIAERKKCEKLDDPVVITPHNLVSCGYMLSLFEEQNDYQNDIITHNNNLYLYNKQLEEYKDTRFWASVSVVFDGVTIAVSLVGMPLSLGSLAAIDAATLADLIISVEDVYVSNSNIREILKNIKEETEALQSAVKNYNHTTALIKQHKDATDRSCHICAGFISETVDVDWPKVKPIY